MKIITKVVLNIVVILALLCVFQGQAFASEIITGKTKYDDSYTYDTTTRTLTFNYTGSDSIISWPKDKRVYSAEYVHFAEGFQEVSTWDGDDTHYKSVKQIYIPASAKGVSGNAQCTEIVVNAQNKWFKSFNGALYNKSMKKIIQVPVRISGKFIVPKGVTIIDYNAFDSCIIDSVVIPDSVKRINEEAFIGCQKLKKITFLGKAPAFEDGAFWGVKATAYHPYDKTWTNKKTKMYGGQINWCATTNGTIANTITVQDKTIQSNGKKQEVSLKAKVLDNAKLSYQSNNNKVKISRKGKVVIDKSFVGRADITVTAAKTKKYGKTSKMISITVLPQKVKITSLKSSKGSIVLKIGKVSCSGYQIQLNSSKSFKVETMYGSEQEGDESDFFVKYSKSGYAYSTPYRWKTEKKEKLKKGKTYYVRVRAIQLAPKDGNYNYYGPWTIKSVKVK